MPDRYAKQKEQAEGQDGIQRNCQLLFMKVEWKKVINVINEIIY